VNMETATSVPRSSLPACPARQRTLDFFERHLR
jgi:hypothetical protein